MKEKEIQQYYVKYCCVDCGNMKVYGTSILDKSKTKVLHCNQGHLLDSYSKSLNPSGIIDGMTHRLEFKKAKTCPDWDDMRLDDIDKDLKTYLTHYIHSPETTIDKIMERLYGEVI